MKRIALLSLLALILVTVSCKKIENRNEVTNMNRIKVILNGNTYDMTLENNETAESFQKLLPLKFEMNELNGNEKYIYMDDEIPSYPKEVDKIEKGDVMLYESNCLVVFYKTFETKYSYTKIGHISNLEDLDANKIAIRFEK